MAESLPRGATRLSSSHAMAMAYRGDPLLIWSHGHTIALLQGKEKHEDERVHR